MLSNIGKKCYFGVKLRNSVKITKKKKENICSIHISLTFSRCNPIEQNPVILLR